MYFDSENWLYAKGTSFCTYYKISVIEGDILNSVLEENSSYCNYFILYKSAWGRKYCWGRGSREKEEGHMEADMMMKLSNIAERH